MYSTCSIVEVRGRQVYGWTLFCGSGEFWVLQVTHHPFAHSHKYKKETVRLTCSGGERGEDSSRWCLLRLCDVGERR